MEGTWEPGRLLAKVVQEEGGGGKDGRMKRSEGWLSRWRLNIDQSLLSRSKESPAETFSNV